MPVIVIPYDSTLVINFVTGTDPETSAPIITRDSFIHVKDTAANQDVYDVANQLISLQKHTVDSIEREDSMQLTE